MHNLFHCGCSCGELPALFNHRRGSGWLKSLFSTGRDDHEWLMGLLKKGEITKHQFKWLSKVFKEKHESEREYANNWWTGLMSQRYIGSFNVHSVPNFIARVGRKTHKHWYDKYVQKKSSTPSPADDGLVHTLPHTGQDDLVHIMPVKDDLVHALPVKDDLVHTLPFTGEDDLVHTMPVKDDLVHALLV